MRVGDPSPAARWRGVFPAKVRAFTFAWSCGVQVVTSLVQLAKPSHTPLHSWPSHNPLGPIPSTVFIPTLVTRWVTSPSSSISVAR